MRDFFSTKTPGGTSPPNNKPAFFRRWDVLVVAALLAVAGIWLAFTIAKPTGALATISLAQNGAETVVQQVHLGKDDTLHLTGGGLAVTLEIKDGAIRFINSQCPDHLCEDFGWLQREGEWAFCAPAGVMVRIVANG